MSLNIELPNSDEDPSKPVQSVSQFYEVLDPESEHWIGSQHTTPFQTFKVRTVGEPISRVSFAEKQRVLPSFASFVLFTSVALTSVAHASAQISIRGSGMDIPTLQGINLKKSSVPKSPTNLYGVLGRLLQGEGRRNLIQNLQRELEALQSDDLNYFERVNTICAALHMIELTEFPDSPKQAVIRDIRARLSKLPTLTVNIRNSEYARVLEILSNVAEADRIAKQFKLSPAKLADTGSTYGGKKLFRVK